MGFYIETLKQDSPAKRAQRDAWNRSTVNEIDTRDSKKKYNLAQIYSVVDPQRRFYAIVDENLEICLPGNPNDESGGLKSEIAKRNLSSLDANSGLSVLAKNIGLHIGKNSKFIGPKVQCTISPDDKELRIKVKGIVPDQINLAKQLSWFGINLSPIDPKNF